MRIGINPQKEKSIRIPYKKHRVIIPLYIPNENDSYYAELFNVFKISLDSLLKTIDVENTNITIINNNCKPEVSEYLDDLLKKNTIDKHVQYASNYGKVHTILQEAKGAFEDFITIADADVFYFNNWQNNVQDVFSNFKNAGVVGLTPDPQMTFYCNASLWSSSIFKIKKGTVVDKKDLELFERGINKKDFFITKKYNWKEKQFYLKKNNCVAITGASHFASTYRREVFSKIPFQKPMFVFPGGELNFLDTPIDQLGFGRLSLPKAFVYHMGNVVEEEVHEWLNGLKRTELKAVKLNPRFSIYMPYGVKRILLRIIKKII